MLSLNWKNNINFYWKKNNLWKDNCTNKKVKSFLNCEMKVFKVHQEKICIKMGIINKIIKTSRKPLRKWKKIYSKKKKKNKLKN
jgi:hypothetical protein